MVPQMSTDETGAGTRYMVPAVYSAGRILQYLAGFHHPRATLSQIATSLDLNKTSCLRILRTLDSQGFVHYDEPTKTYSLGILLVVFGSRAVEQNDYLAASLPYLTRISELSGLTSVIVGRYANNQHMYVAKREPATAIGVSVTVGQRFPLTAGAHGKVLLAYLDPETTSQSLNKIGLPAFTPNSITDPAAYLRELKQVRENGYALSLEEHFPGISGLSVPVFGPTGEVVFAMSAFGIASGLPAKRLRDFAVQAKELADEASRKLGVELALDGPGAKRAAGS